MPDRVHRTWHVDEHPHMPKGVQPNVPPSRSGGTKSSPGLVA
jgi:hypothetical protein